MTSTLTERVVARHLSAYVEVPDYDEPEENDFEAAKREDLAYWDKVEAVFFKFAKTYVKPLVANPSFEPEFRSAVSDCFFKAKGSHTQFNIALALHTRSPRGCYQSPLEHSWNYRNKEAIAYANKLRTGKKLDRAHRQIESVEGWFRSLAEFKAYSEGTEIMEALEATADVSGWSQKCLDVANALSDHVHKLKYASSMWGSPTILKNFQEAWDVARQGYKTIKPIFEKAWLQFCGADRQLDKFTDAWWKVRQITLKAYEDFRVGDKSAVVKLYAVRVETCLRQYHEVMDRGREAFDRDLFVKATKWSDMQSEYQNAQRKFLIDLIDWDLPWPWTEHHPKSCILKAVTQLEALDRKRGTLF